MKHLMKHTQSDSPHSLQRAVDQDYLDEWARQLRQPELAATLLDQTGLAFRIGAEWLMLPTSMVDSIAPMAAAHTLPHRRGAGLSGIVNVGGAIVPAIALDTLLGIDGAAAPAAGGRHVFARLLVARVDGQRFALPVADLHGMVRYATGQVQAPAATINKGLQRFLAGVLALEDKMIGVLDAGLVGRQMTGLLR
jgi:chemotaxis-related protein WspD